MSPPDEAHSPPPLGALHAGDPVAWRKAFALLWAPALRSARRQLGDAADAEEVAAQALQETRQAASTTASWSEVVALAVVIARRRAISRRRGLGAQKRQPGTLVSIDSEEILEEGEPPQLAAMRALDVQTILSRLAADQRKLLEDYFLHGLTSEEVARKRGVPAVTVRSQVMRLLAQLREPARNRSSAERDTSSGAVS